MARKEPARKSGNGANLGFEEKLWAAADKMRGHMDAAEYKHVVLGLIFLKYISDAFEERRAMLEQLACDPASDWYVKETMNKRQRAVVDAYHAAKHGHDAAQQALQPWIVRYNKGVYWVAMGATRRDTRVRLMRAFNTPFFPDILVCSQVMGEGVDLQRFCRHVIHHDLDWNPSTIEQRTGRVDRLGCKAEGRHPIDVYLPYLAGTADERQYRVMSDRERWFRVVMGQDEVARLITPDSDGIIPLPDAISTELSFRLDSLSV